MSNLTQPELYFTYICVPFELHDLSEAQKLVRLYWNPRELMSTQLRLEIKFTGRFGLTDYQTK